MIPLTRECTDFTVQVSPLFFSGTRGFAGQARFAYHAVIGHRMSHTYHGVIGRYPAWTGFIEA